MLASPSRKASAWTTTDRSSLRSSPSFGEFFKHEGAVIQSGSYQVSESPLRISVEATERLAQAARDAGINAEFPTFVAALFKRALAAGYGEQEVAAMIKVLRASAETRAPVAVLR